MIPSRGSPSNEQQQADPRTGIPTFITGRVATNRQRQDGNVFNDSNGDPSIIDALIGEVPAQMIEDIPRVKQVIAQAKALIEEIEDNGENDHLLVVNPTSGTSDMGETMFDREAKSVASVIAKVGKRFSQIIHPRACSLEALGKLLFKTCRSQALLTFVSQKTKLFGTHKTCEDGLK